MNRAAWVSLVPLFALAATPGRAATAYVSDDLVLGVYAEKNQLGPRLTTLHSGAVVDALGTSGEFTQVQLADGTSGWVKSSFLITHKPATLRVKELEDELSRARATTPELAEAAARSELEQLKSQLAAAQSELQSAREAAAASAATAIPVAPAADSPALRHVGQFLHLPWVTGLGLLLALVLGFSLGYGVLARRLKKKFGGIKVY
ncbi:MAG TPA: SH3 domain-containing protein [Steroidobacteraceae bacterium]|nr:SH3 domain-containing protein [Steroidobacteraceae bacterium]